MQKIIAVIAFIFIFSSCADRSKNELKAFKVIEEGLSRSNKQINRETTDLFESFKEKLQDPATKEQAELWYPKAMLVQALSNTLIKYIEDLKISLKKEAGVKTEKIQELYERLQHYKQHMLAVDPELDRTFADKFILTTDDFDTDTTRQKNFSNTFFDDVPLAAALSILSTFENNISIQENHFVEFCKNKTGYLEVGFVQ